MKEHSYSSLYTLWAMIIMLAVPTVTGSRDLSGGDYVIGPGDVLDIQVWDHNDLNRTIEVSPKGNISFPFVGEVKVSNLTLFQIENILEKKLADGYLVAPQVTANVKTYENKQVYLFGEVKRPGSYILQPGSNLLRLISEAGGFTDDRGSDCIIVRSDGQAGSKGPVSIGKAKKNEMIRLDLEMLLSGTLDNGQFHMKPGDSVYITRAEHIFVTGEVKAPGRLRWERGLTVRQAISMAGGCTNRASINRTEIIRNKKGEERTYKIKLNETVQPNDIIRVPESYF